MLYLEHICITSSGIVFKDRMGKGLSLTDAFRKGINRLFNYVLDFELLIVRIAGFAIVGGVPAKVIGERELKELNYKLGRARLFQ